MALNIIDLSAVSGREENFTVFLDQLCQRLDLDFASYAMIGPFSGTIQGYANYPEPWKNHYMRQGLHRSHSGALRRSGIAQRHPGLSGAGMGEAQGRDRRRPATRGRSSTRFSDALVDPVSCIQQS